MKHINIQLKVNLLGAGLFAYVQFWPGVVMNLVLGMVSLALLRDAKEEK